MENRIIIYLIIGAGIIFSLAFVLGGITTGKQIKEVNNTIVKTIDCPKCRACPPEKICDPCPQCPVCRQNSCPIPEPCPAPDECPRCMTSEYIQDNLYDIAKLRPKAESPAWQDGFFVMRNLCLESFGYKNISKFKEARSMFDPDLFYMGGTGDKNEGYFTFRQFEKYGNQCFNISQYPDETSRKRWNWDHDDCKGSTLTICHL